jgi:hypothetical protein
VVLVEVGSVRCVEVVRAGASGSERGTARGVREGRWVCERRAWSPPLGSGHNDVRWVGGREGSGRDDVARAVVWGCA